MKGIYLVTDQKACQGKSLESVVLDAIKGGVSCVQLREKDTSIRLFLKKALGLKSILKRAKIPLIINDRVDIALAAKADGVHLGQSDMPYEYARRLMGPGAVIGLSVETWEDVQKAQDLDVDYLGVSPVFSTPTKTDTKTPWGLEGLEKIRRYSRHPLVAIGGLGASNVQNTIKAGADAIAVVSAICSANDSFDATKQLVSIFEQTQFPQERRS
ncbi:MAG: thiamine phosphate synthase [Deltaproteobacteria bacterium]|uniref:thiamine phosphate synthase n=1 Tax=Desulfobacula sp. TaxID=2593537 RepID=UPI0019C0F979|nr:thiamine phosphate synthase [Candidatus Desulfobacula maris]MBL6996084.1 thiamine phosphate synthase [Desulfobacula sp.]